MHNHFIDKKRRFINLRDAKVESVLPEHFDTSYPKFISLLEKYYDYMDSDHSTELLSHIFASRDVNETDITLLSYIEDELLLGEAYFEGFGETEAQKRASANFSNILFRSKGTKFAIEWFFRSFYGIDAEVIYTKENIFKIGETESRIGPDSLRFITDDKLYQTFALLVRAGVPISKWRETFKTFAHPAGMYLGAEVLVEEDVQVGVNTLMDALSVTQRTTPSYSISVAPADSGFEGSTFDYAVVGTDVPDNIGALFYYVSHQTTSDSDFAQTVPSSDSRAYLPINDSSGAAVGRFNLQTRTDSDEAEGTEVFTVLVEDQEGRSQASSVINLKDVISSYTITPSDLTPNEGDIITFDVEGTNVPNNGNATLFYYVEHVDTQDSDFTEVPPSTSNAAPFSITNNTGSFSLRTIIDPTSEGEEEFRVGLQTEPTGGLDKGSVLLKLQEVAPTFNLTVNDIVEGSDVTASLVVDPTTVGRTINWSIPSDPRLDDTSGSFEITAENGNYTLTGTTPSSTFEGPISRTVSVDTVGIAFQDSDSFTITDAAPEYTITSSPTIGQEGSSTTFTIGGSNIPDTPVEFYIEHLTTNDSDFNPNTPPLTGSPRAVTITGGTGSTSLSFAANTDVTEEEFRVYVRSGGDVLATLDYSILGSAIYTLTPSSTSIDESTTFNTQFYTTDADGNYYYSIAGTGVSSSDFDAGWPTYGGEQFTVVGGYGNIQLDLKADNTREGNETFQIYVSKSPFGAIISQSPTITISDTSVPTYTVSSGNTTEGNTHTVIITPVNATETETMHVKITGSGVVGRFTTTEQTVSVNSTGFKPVYFSTTVDNAYNGPQTGTVTVRFDDASGAIVGTDTFTLNDEDIDATLVTDLTNDSANEGDTINFTFSGNNIPDDTFYFRPVNVYPAETTQSIASGTRFIYLEDTSFLQVGMETNEANIPGTITSVVSSGVQMSADTLSTIPSGWKFHYSSVGIFDDFSSSYPATGTFSTSSNSGTFRVDTIENNDVTDDSYTFGVYDSHNTVGFGTSLALKTVSINDTTTGPQALFSSGMPSTVSRTQAAESVTAEIQFRADGNIYGSFSSITTSNYTYNASTHYWEAIEIDPGDYEVTVVWDGVTVIDAEVFIDYEPSQLIGINDNRYIQGSSQGGGRFAVARATEGMYLLGTWLNPTDGLPADAGDYRVTVSKSNESGETSNTAIPSFNGSFNTPLGLSYLRYWTITINDNGGTTSAARTASADLSFTVYEHSNSQNSDTWNVTFSATENYAGGRSGGGGR